LFRRYARAPLGSLEDVLAEVDLIVFEGTAALLLVERFRSLAPRARLVYRATDDLRRLPVHPLLLEAEVEAVPQVDLVSVSTLQIAVALAPYGDVHVHPPAVDKAAFDRPTASPYGAGPAAVFAGVTRHFDYETLTTATKLAPHVAFHVIGLAPGRPAENVTFNAEMPFESVAPYLQHATFGLLFFPPGYPGLAEGNKVMQYSYCRLPIVAPSHLQPERENMCVFEAGDTASLRRALAAAERMPHSPSFADGILSAEELAAILAGDAPAEGAA
jgi:2-beta-glucuronyltransferase